MAESNKPKTKRQKEVNESTKKLEEVFEKLDSEIENQQELVPVEDNLENESESTESNKISLSNSLCLVT